MAIRFLRDYTVQDRERTTYAKDEVRDDLSPASEDHFVSRNVAVYVEAGQHKSKLPETEEKIEQPAKPARRKQSKRTAS